MGAAQLRAELLSVLDLGEGIIVGKGIILGVQICSGWSDGVLDLSFLVLVDIR